MDTKWKKWKNRIGLVMFIIGLSLIVLCITTSARQMIDSESMYGHIQFSSHNDYQELDAFKESISQTLETYLLIANGTYVDWNYSDMNYTYAQEYANEVASKAIEEAGIAIEEATTVSPDFPFMSPEELENYLASERYYGDYPDASCFSDEQIKKMSEDYLKSEEKNLNLLYRITNNGKVLYTNMAQEYDFGKALPDGYNYVLYFDGTKVHVKKDGQNMDVYGNGICNENSHYNVPGYTNYEADDSLKNVTVTLVAIKTPMEYRSIGQGKYFNSGDTYYIYNNMIRINETWQRIFVYGLAGILLLVLSIFFCHGITTNKEKLARLLNCIWIEGKLITIAIIVYITVFCLTHSEYGYWFTQEMGYYFYDYGSYSEGIRMLFRELYSALLQEPIVCMVYFWTLYLLVFDIIYNHKKSQNSFFLTLLRGLNDRSLKMDFAKRQLRRMSLLLLLCVISVVMFIIGICSTTFPIQIWSIVLILLAIVLFITGFCWYYKLVNCQAKDLDMLVHQIEKISQGDYEPERMPFMGNDLEIVEDNLLQIQNGIKNAVNDQLMSERMKVDLVANVSHDLKTPLTSIISYIQFLKEEENLPEHVKDYVRILDEKSLRLNEMVQDVFSISKASSGQLPVSIEVLDFGKLLNQTLADMAETISHSCISIKSDIKEHAYYIAADGQRMYRVCQNLIQNALKYSLAGSRMFITLEQIENQAVATFKNTSKSELNLDTDFAARFVRGDKSRTDGGSGLGLSIAKSFTEACGGQFTININGDMFIVTVSFDLKTRIAECTE